MIGARESVPTVARHAERICPHPAVNCEDRLCWTCGKKNHSSRGCPDKPSRPGGNERQPLKAIEDLLRGHSVFAITSEDDDGWRQASQIQRRPQRRRITVGDFMTTTSVSNKYDMLQDSDSGRRRRIKAVHSAPDVVHKDPTPKVAYDSGCARSCVRTTTSLDDMTLDELD